MTFGSTPHSLGAPGGQGQSVTTVEGVEAAPGGQPGAHSGGDCRRPEVSTAKETRWAETTGSTQGPFKSANHETRAHKP